MLTKDNRLLSLHLNGIVDTERVVPAPGVVPNSGRLVAVPPPFTILTLIYAAPIYVGNDPWHPGVKCYVDDLVVFDRVLSEEDKKVRMWR